MKPDLHSMGDRKCTAMATFMAVCAFVLSGTLPIRAIWIEIPVLSKSVPEGPNLYIYVFVISECSNIAAVIYFLMRKCSKLLPNEARIIYGSLMVGIASMVMLGIFWRNMVPDVKNSFSFTLLSSVLLASIVASLSTMTYIPFVSRLKESFVNAAMFGEALSSLIPHIMATVQGIGREPECFAADADTLSNISSKLSELPNPTARVLHQRTSVIHLSKQQSLQFSEQVYFFAHAGFITISLLCFVAVRCMAPFRLLTGVQPPNADVESRDQTKVKKNHHHQHHHHHHHHRGKTESICQSKRTTSQSTTVLDDGTVRQSGILHLNPAKHSRHACAEQTPLTGGDVTQSHSDDCETSDFNSHPSRPPPQLPQPPQKPTKVSGGAKSLRRFARASSLDRAEALKATAGGRPKLFPLLMIIVLWSSFLMNGPLSSVYTYSCFAMGNNVFLVGVILCDIFTLLSCILSSKTTEMSVVIAFTCLGTILLTYFLALIIFTLETQTKEFPPFGNTGEILTMFIWVSIVGLFSFARLRIGLECHMASVEALLWYVGIIRLGDILGLLTIFRRVSICRIFRIFDKSCLK